MKDNVNIENKYCTATDVKRLKKIPEMLPFPI